MKLTLFILFISFSLILLSCNSSGKRPKADLVLTNAAIWTVNPDQEWAGAVAVKDDKICAVSSPSRIKKWIGPDTRVLDLEGAFVLPGFTDCHTHFLEGGLSLTRLDLREASSREEFVALIGAKAEELEKGRWILDGIWDHQKFDPPELPRRDWIDDQTPDNPVCISRHDGHMVLCNGLALKMAGITRDTPSPKGGEIVKDSVTGDPTGILRDAAMNLVQDIIPEPSPEEKMDAARRALRLASACGLTSIHDMAYGSNFDVYLRLLEADELTARMHVYIQITEMENYEKVKSRIPENNLFLKLAGLKGFVDGSLGSSTALFFEPYTDNPRTSGLLHEHMFPEGVMEERIREADRAGLQVAVHAIGDRANHILLDIFESAITEGGERDRRWRIEHAQHLIPEDIPRFAALGVIPSVQPYHVSDDGRWAERKIGKKRARYTYAFRSLIEGGAVLAGGSDWTVAPLDPLLGIYAAVTRRTSEGEHSGGWIPEERIEIREAIKAYTWNAAYSEFAEDLKGSVEKGKLADLVVLDRNLFEIPPETIKDARVLYTILGGKIVFDALEKDKQRP
jgi:predicted amidohydrolase YtcJ